jgi:hypothetical protein
MPTIKAVMPSTGPTGGGTDVTIIGSGFGNSVSNVRIGTASVPFTVLNGTTIRAKTPSHAAGTVAVGVTGPSGTVTGGSFTYLAPTVPAVRAVDAAHADKLIRACQRPCGRPRRAFQRGRNSTRAGDLSALAESGTSAGTTR